MKQNTAMARSTLIRRLLLGAAALVLIAVLAVFVGYRQMAPTPQQLVAALPKSANLTMGKVDHSATRDGRTEWRLKAKSATLTEGQKRLALESPDVVYYMEDGREILLEAEGGTLNTSDNDMTAQGRVRARDGRWRLETETLEYSHKKRTVICPVPVRVFGRQSEAAGDRMVYDMNTGRIELEGHVDVRLRQKLRI